MSRLSAGDRVLRVGVYLRVSSKYGKRQDEMNQEPVCRQLCEARKWEPIFYRERESAVKERPEWGRLMEDARRGTIRGVVFYSIHRIGRKRVQIAYDLAELARFGMAVVSTREKFLDVDNTPELAKMRDMLIQWWGWFAESERDDLIDKTNMALARVKENLARAGSHVSKKGNVVTRLGRPSKLTDEQRAKVRELAVLNWTPGQIARAMEAAGLGKAHRSTIRDFLAWCKEQKGAA